MRRLAALASLLFALTPAVTYSQTTISPYVCESPEVRTAYQTTLSANQLVWLPSPERRARTKQTLDALVAKYPYDYVLYRGLSWVHDYTENDEIKTATTALHDRWINDAKAHPDDPVALIRAGLALKDDKREEAIQYFEAARAKASNFPWPSYELADIYKDGKYADEAKFKENLEHFYTLCPAWVETADWANQMEGFKLRRDLPLVAKTVPALREELAQQTDPLRLIDYQILWQREFQTRPPAEHDAERAQIKADLARLEKLVPNGDAHWRLFLLSGYDLSGISTEESKQMWAQAAKDFPHEEPAERVYGPQWRKDHPQPEGQKNTEAWKAYYAALVEFDKTLIRDYPHDPNAQRSGFLIDVLDDPYLSEADGVAAVDLYLKTTEKYGYYGIVSVSDTDPPKFLLNHGWQPARALDLLKKTGTYKNGGITPEPEDWQKTLATDDLKRFRRSIVHYDIEALGLILRAAELAGKPEEAFRFRTAIEGPAPENKNDLAQYWTNRARLAALDHHPQDAFVYYRTALDNRTQAPEYTRGVLRDDLTIEFHALWTHEGGSETAWNIMNPPESMETTTATNDTPAATKPETTKSITPAHKKPAIATGPEGQWKKVTTKMPSFALSDFTGKQWRQQDLSGKVVVVVSWATWCGPCRLQDKYLEEFYEKVKDRKDLLVLSMNIDENPGQVQPFMREHGYTFPVLAAGSYEQAQHMVPRTWIIDKQGNWLWVKDGYDESKTYPEFEKDLTSQIGKVATGQ